MATLDGDLMDLRAFCLVVDLGSITAAARTLGETKGSVSRRLTRLEQGVGVTLVRRSPRLVQPTEHGLSYRMRIGRALELLDDATSVVQECNAEPRGHLRVTAPQDLAVGVLGPLVARFGEQYPEVTVEMLLTEKALDFDAHQLDVALRAASSLRDSSLIAHKLLELGFGLYAAPDYLARHGAPETPEALEAHRLLLFRATGGHVLLSLARPGEEGSALEVRLKGQVLAPDGAFVREVALAGGGISLMPSLLVERDVAQGRLVPVLEAWRVMWKGSLYLLHPPLPFIPPKTRAFRDFMTKAFQQLSGGREQPSP